MLQVDHVAALSLAPWLLLLLTFWMTSPPNSKTMTSLSSRSGSRRRRSPRLNPHLVSTSALTPFSLDSPASTASTPNATSGKVISSGKWWNQLVSRFTRQPAQLPRKPRSVRKLLVLDLDETLIHATTRSQLFTPFSTKIVPSLRIEVEIQGHPVLYYVYVRPHVGHFIRQVNEWFDLAIYTASVQEYADPIIDYLERLTGIKFRSHQRFFRPDCIPVDPNHSIASHALDSRTLALGHPFGSHPYWKDLRVILQRWRGSWRRRRRVASRSNNPGSTGLLDPLGRRGSQQRSHPQHQRARQRYDSVSSEDILLSDRSHLESADDTASSTSVATAITMQAEFLDLLLSKTILLDNSPLSFHPQPRNGLPIVGWINDPNDEALVDVLTVLDALRFVDDVRHVLSFRLIEPTTTSTASGIDAAAGVGNRGVGMAE